MAAIMLSASAVLLTVHASEKQPLNPEIITQFKPVGENKNCTNETAITARLQAGESDKLAVYYAVRYGESEAEWYRNELFTKGTVATVDRTQKNISVAFLSALPTANAADGDIAYADFSDTALFSSVSAVVMRNDFFVDVNAPLIHIKSAATGGDYDYTAISGSLLGSTPYYVDLTLRFQENSLFTTGIEYIKINGYGSSPVIISPSELKDGEYVLRVIDEKSIQMDENGAIVSYERGVREVEIFVYDTAGNAGHVKFKLGLPKKEQPLTFEEKEAFLTDYELQNRRYEVSVYPDVYPDIQTDIIDPIKAQYKEEYRTVSDFNVYEPLSIGDMSEVSIARYIANIQTWCGRYSAVLSYNDPTMNGAAYARFKTLVEYVKTFRKAMFTSSGVTAVAENFYYETVEQLTDRLNYRLKVTIRNTEDEKLPELEEAQTAFQKESQLIAAISLKIFDGDRDATSEFRAVPTVVTVLQADSIYNIDRIAPIVTVYNAENRKLEETNILLGTSLVVNLDGITGEICIAASLVKNSFLYYFLVIGVPILAAMIFAIIAIVLVYVWKKKSRDSDEQLKKLKIEADKKRKIAEIAKRSREEEEELNRRHAEEIERERQEAIERVRAERRKKLTDREEQLREEAQKREAEMQDEELNKYKMLAMQKSRRMQKKTTKKVQKKKDGNTKKTDQ